jgi:hypothetical protein
MEEEKRRGKKRKKKSEKKLNLVRERKEKGQNTK